MRLAHCRLLRLSTMLGSVLVKDVSVIHDY